MFDQNSGHTAYQNSDLSTNTMNIKFGGKVEYMRSTTSTNKCFEKYPAKMKVGDTQNMSFPPINKCTAADGLFYLLDQEKHK